VVLPVLARHRYLGGLRAQQRLLGDSRMTGANNRTAAPVNAEPLDTQLAIRIAALQAAATFAGGKALSVEVSTADVLKVAAAFQKWLEQREP
jgi:hypothetical protein